MRCPTCFHARCPRCDPTTLPVDVTRWSPCRQCLSTQFINAFAAVELPLASPQQREARDVAIDRAVGILPAARMQAWKSSTGGQYVGIARRIEEWGEGRGIRLLGDDPLLTWEIVVAFYLDRIDEGEGVQPETVSSDLTVIKHWYESFVQFFPDRAQSVHPVDNPTMRDLKRRANLWFSTDPVKKLPFDISHLRRFVGDCRISGDWQFDHSRLVILTLFFFLVRSIGAAHLMWYGDWRGPTPAVAPNRSDIQWGRDAAGQRYAHYTVRVDKTLGYRKTSDRFVPDDTGTGIDVNSFTRDYIRHYRLPSGTHLLAVRRQDGTFHSSTYTNWGRPLAQLCAANHLDVAPYGTQSCRRGCAEMLNRAGVNFEDISLLGYWLSNAVRRYTGEQAEPRLAAWTQAALSSALRR